MFFLSHFQVPKQYSVIYRRALLHRIPNTNLIVTDSILNQIKSLQNKISQICFLKPKCPKESYYKLLSRHSFFKQIEGITGK